MARAARLAIMQSEAAHLDAVKASPLMSALLGTSSSRAVKLESLCAAPAEELQQIFDETFPLSIAQPSALEAMLNYHTNTFLLDNEGHPITESSIISGRQLVDDEESVARHVRHEITGGGDDVRTSQSARSQRETSHSSHRQQSHGSP